MDSSDSENFGPPLAIERDSESLVLLASNIAKRCLGLPSTSGTLIERMSGSYNTANVIELENVKLVIRVPAIDWGSGLTRAAADAMESQVATIRLIRSKTTIPVPEVYALDTSVNNEIGAPYTCMSFIPGTPVCQAWFDYSGALPRDEFRFNILTSLSQIMAQFSCFSFEQMGSIMGSGSDSTIIGPLYRWHEKKDGSLKVIKSGPYDSTSAFLHKKLILLGCLPTPGPDSPSSFVLSPPDFHSGNVLVDDEGTVTGLIDWDLAQTMPRFLGYARYPKWITRDFDPSMDGRPKMPLEPYRAHYNTELGKALEWQGDWRYTKKSHHFEAIWVAATDRSNRQDICEKFVRDVLGNDANVSDIFFHIGKGDYAKEDWVTLKTKLRRFIREG